MNDPIINAPISKIVEAIRNKNTEVWKDVEEIRNKNIEVWKDSHEAIVLTIAEIEEALASLGGEEQGVSFDDLMTFEWDTEKDEMFDETGKAYTGSIVSKQQLEMMYRTIEALKRFQPHPSEREALMPKVFRCGKCEMLGDVAPCDECYRNGFYCAEKYSVGYTYESQCDRCKKADQLTEPPHPFERDERIDKLQKFKEYVHKRLDDAGIEKEPNGEHSKHGCRIGDRLDIALKHPSEREVSNQTIIDATNVIRALLNNWEDATDVNIKKAQDALDLIQRSVPYIDEKAK